jgi:hypothetical protein
MSLLPNPFSLFTRKEPQNEAPITQTLPIIQQQGGGPPPTETAKLVLDHQNLEKNIRNKFWNVDPVQASTSNINGIYEKQKRMDAYRIRQDIKFNNLPTYPVLVGKKMDVIGEKNLSLDYDLLLDDFYSKGLYGEGSRMVTASSNRTEIQNTLPQPITQPQKKGLFGFLGI